jgi:hypothetical protein
LSRLFGSVAFDSGDARWLASRVTSATRGDEVTDVIERVEVIIA